MTADATISAQRVADLVATAKVRRRRAQPEAQLQRQVMAHVDARSAPGTLVWHTPNGGWRSRIEAAIMKALGVRPGIPDLLALKAGRLCAIELKAPGGKLSKAQQEMIAKLKAAGARVEVASSLDDALGHLERWGILRGQAQ
jgi:hypothetical protein